MSSQLQDQSTIITLLEKIKPELDQFLVLLSQKERFVIERRFNLDNQKKYTLEEIGQHFNVTRERVRQIEKNALLKLKRNIEKFELFYFNDIAYRLLKENGGVIREDLLLSKIITKDQSASATSLILILSLDKRFEHLTNTIHFHPYFRFTTITDELVDKICSFSISELQQKRDIIDLESISKDLRKNIVEAKNCENIAFLSLFQVHKSFKLIDNYIGLAEWKHINPKTLRDKIYYVLREKHEPRHFIDIANDISNYHFDQKNLNLQAVHNELIRHNDFVLVGRGIYALQEWGYNHGTVAQVISNVLKDKPAMSEDEIIEAVLKQRKVKPITVLLNLKNNQDFVRVGRKQYSLRPR